MNVFCSIFSQLLQLFPRMEFQRMVKKHDAEHSAKGFTCWGQFVSMLFCQLGRAHSLREIVNGLRSCEGKLRHLGIEAPKRATLSYANMHRPWELYRDVFFMLFDRCKSEVTGRKRKFRFKNKLVSLDSSTIDLCMSLYDWAKFRRTKGAVKLHLVLDHDGYLPSFAVITEGKVSDVKVAHTLKFEPGTIVVDDRGYNDYGLFGKWTAQLFFKALKQNLKIKTFVGTSANAVKIQIWTALITMLILKYLQLKSRYNWSLSNLMSLLRMNLFTHRNLWAWLDSPFETLPVQYNPDQIRLDYM